ncbi:MAG TPA: DUF1203 domain-containing protein [Acidimicrobiales bacterium]|nr:DUF1203 domain-containing protein [Acidimicrobiales bacterium]
MPTSNAPTSNASVQIHAIEEQVLEAVRRAHRGAAGSEVWSRVASGGEPLRCCLRDARPGDELLLFAYELPLPAGPYQETGPIFVHAERCAGWSGEERYPSEWTRRPQVLRAYDAHGAIHEATRVHDGTRSEAQLAEVLAQPGVVEVHSRNIAYGCFMFRATPPASSDGAARGVQRGTPTR